MKTKSLFTTLGLLAMSATLAVAEQWTTNTLPPGLISWWNADGNTLDMTGLNPASSGGHTYVPGRFGQAFQFNGVNQSVAAPGSASLDQWTEFTLEAWMKLDQTADVVNDAPGRMVINRVGNPNDQVNFNQGYQWGFWNNARNLVLAFSTNGQAWPGVYTEVVLPASLPTNVWLHYAATYDHNAVMLYLNGVPLKTNVIGAATVAHSTSSFRIGLDDNGNCPFPGSIDDVRVYNRALSGNEIVRLVNGPLEPQTVWGLKTHDPTSQPPTTLFRLGESGGYSTIGDVRLYGSDIEADGLARSPAGELLAFQVVSDGSRLVSINPSNAVATVIGPLLSSRNIRGATFLLSGRLLAFDDSTAELIEVNPATGEIIGVPVRVAIAPGDLGSSGDLVQSPDGALLFATLNRVFRLDARSGALTLLLTDTTTLADGYVPYCTGLAWSPALGAESKLIGYEVSIQDDVYEYLPASGFARTQLVDHIVPGYNAGRGDLATVPAARVELLSCNRSGTTFTIETVCRGGLWAWVEFTDDLGAGNWQRVSNTIGWVPYTADTIASPKTWFNLPATGSYRFFRVVTSPRET